MSYDYHTGLCTIPGQDGRNHHNDLCTMPWHDRWQRDYHTDFTLCYTIIILACALCHDMIGDTAIIILTSHYVIRLSYWPVHYVRTRSGDSNYRTDYCQRIIVLNCTLCHGIIRWHNDYHTDMNPVSKDYHTDLCIMSWQEQVTQGLSYWLVHYVMA